MTNKQQPCQGRYFWNIKKNSSQVFSTDLTVLHQSSSIRWSTDGQEITR